MNEIPEDQTKKVCKKLHLDRCVECCEGNHNPLSVFSREESTGQYEKEWKSKELMRILRDYYEPTYEDIKILRASETEDEYHNNLKNKLEGRLGVKNIHNLLINSYQFSKEEARDLMNQYIPFYMSLSNMLIKKENASNEEGEKKCQ